MMDWNFEEDVYTTQPSTQFLDNVMMDWNFEEDVYTTQPSTQFLDEIQETRSEDETQEKRNDDEILETRSAAQEPDTTQPATKFLDVQDPDAAQPTQFLDEILETLSSVHQKEIASKGDSVGCNGHFYIFVGTLLFMLYVNLNLLSLRQVLFCVALIPLVVYIYVDYVSFVLLEDDIKWIGTESRLLRAILKDAAKVEESSAKTQAKALRLWDSQVQPHSPSIKIGLDEKEEEWVKETERVVQEAVELVNNFKKRKRGFWKMFKNLEVVGDLLQQTGHVKEEINYYAVAKKKKSKAETNKICATMEQSRHQIRCLLDRPIDIGHNHRWVSKSKKVIEAAKGLSSLIARNPVLKSAIKEKRLWINLRFVLELLPPFLEEIQEVYLEGEIEIAWLDELEEILIQANHAINNVTLRNKPPHIFNTPAAAAAVAAVLFVTNWKAIEKLKKVVKRTALAFSNLFERKEGYDFRFITRYGSGFCDLFSSSDLLHITAYPIPSVIRKIHDYLNEMLPMFSELHYKVKLLGDELEYMSKLLYNEYAAKGGNVSRIIWLKQIRDIAQMADHCLQTLRDNSDTIVTTTHPLETEPGKAISIEIDEILEYINLLKGVIKVFNIESVEESSWVVGLEEDVHVLVSQLTHGTGSWHDHSVVSILGMEGIGKTTLAKKIYNHRAVVDNFPLRVWVSLTQDHQLHGNSILEQVGEEVLNSFGLNFNMEERCIRKVVEILRNRKHILVLDNVSTTQALDTLKLKLKLSDIKNGSRILLTTRNRDVAEQSNSAPHQLQLRTKEESWRLFIQMVRMSQEDEPRAKEMLTRTCAGLPLAILHLGYLMLGNEATIEQLERVIYYTKTNDKPLLDAFKGTTNRDVPTHLIKCLSYFKLFPSTFEISARRLVTLWVAEGLIQQRGDDKETPEEVAEKYLSELISRNMVQVVERKLNGKVKKCCLPIALQQLWLQNNKSLDHRLADHFNRDDPCFGHIHGEENSTMPRDFQNYKHLVSFLSFDTREGNKPGEEIGYFLRRGIGFGYFHKLHVLDLEGVFRPQLPDSIVKLSKLRYLGLRWTYLETIPSCIGKLVHLETLDVKHTYVRTVPNSIWKLQKLRHLYLNQRYRSQIMRHPSGISLKNLQTLWGIFVSKDSPVEDGLDKLVNLRKLGLAFHLDESQQVALSKWIVKLNHLQSLRLRSIDEMGEPCEMFLESFFLENLSSLELFGILKNTSVVDNLPHNLTSLTLSASFLTDDPMPMLEKLDNLTLLCLYGNSYTGKRLVCSMGKFSKLLVLRIWKLEELEELEVNENALKNLRELEIRSCWRLEVPAGLKHLKTLIELKLSDMPLAFAEKIEIEKKNFWDDIMYAPSITVSN